jgi:hypothetical protein
MRDLERLIAEGRSEQPLCWSQAALSRLRRRPRRMAATAAGLSRRPSGHPICRVSVMRRGRSRLVRALAFSCHAVRLFRFSSLPLTVREPV